MVSQIGDVVEAVGDSAKEKPKASKSTEKKWSNRMVYTIIHRKIKWNQYAQYIKIFIKNAFVFLKKK